MQTDSTLTPHRCFRSAELICVLDWDLHGGTAACSSEGEFGNFIMNTENVCLDVSSGQVIHLVESVETGKGWLSVPHKSYTSSLLLFNTASPHIKT